MTACDAENSLAVRLGLGTGSGLSASTADSAEEDLGRGLVSVPAAATQMSQQCEQVLGTWREKAGRLDAALRREHDPGTPW